MRMPFVLGAIVPGFSRAILNVPKKPVESWISMKGFGKDIPFKMTSSFCLPMKKPASRSVGVDTPPIRPNRVHP